MTEERELSREALDAAGIVRDAVVTLGIATKEHKRPDHPVRIVEIECTTPHEKRGGRKGKTAGPAAGETLLIATDQLDVPAEVIALIYRATAGRSRSSSGSSSTCWAAVRQAHRPERGRRAGTCSASTRAAWRSRSTARSSRACC